MALHKHTQEICQYCLYKDGRFKEFSNKSKTLTNTQIKTHRALGIP